MSPGSIHLLMTGAGAPGAPGIMHCIKQDAGIHLTVGDADPHATGRWLHPDFIALPHAASAWFAEQLLKSCLERNINYILPLVTKELLPLSENKRMFSESGIHVLVSSEESIRIANNKSDCYAFLQKNNIRVPEFYVVETISQFRDAANELGYPGKPFSFKPSQSNGSRGSRIVSAGINESDLLFNHKPYQHHITYSHANHILSSAPFPELLVSEYLPGHEFSVDCLARHGEVIIAVPRIRKKTMNGISIQGEFIHHEAIIAYCTSIIKAIGLHGNIGIQVKMSEEGIPLLLEINPRVQGTIVAALGAGINLPLLAIKQEMGMEPAASELQVKWGTKFSRYWTEVFY